MALRVVKALDGDEIAAYFVSHLRGHCDEIVKLNIDELAVKNVVDEPYVVAIIVSPLMLKSLQRSKGNKKIKAAFASAANKAFLYIGCEQCAIGKIKKWKFDPQNDSSTTEHIELKEDGDYDAAEIKLRNMVRHAKNKTLTRPPSAKKFLVDPATATEGSVEVKIILLEEDKSYTNITVNIPTFSGNVTPLKLRDGVWMLKLHDIGPGEYELYVTGDETDLGSARITIAARLDAFFDLLPDAVRDNPVELLKEMFALDEEDFDAQLARFLDDGTESKTFFQCVDRIMEQGGEGQTCLHLCARYNLPKLCKRILDRRYNLELREAKDINGKTPLDIARELDHTALIRMLKVEDFAHAPVPAWRSSCTVLEEDSSVKQQSKISRSQTIAASSGFTFRKSRQHVYNEIDDPPVSFSAGREHPCNEPDDVFAPSLRKKKENPYNEPWENTSPFGDVVCKPGPSGHVRASNRGQDGVTVASGLRHSHSSTSVRQRSSSSNL